MQEELERRCQELIKPLVEADGGQVSWEIEETQVRLTLSGTCSGCPGFEWTRGEVIVPLLTPLLESGQELVVSNTRR